MAGSSPASGAGCRRHHGHRLSFCGQTLHPEPRNRGADFRYLRNELGFAAGLYRSAFFWARGLFRAGCIHRGLHDQPQRTGARIDRQPVAGFAGSAAGHSTGSGGGWILRAAHERNLLLDDHAGLCPDAVQHRYSLVERDRRLRWTDRCAAPGARAGRVHLRF